MSTDVAIQTEIKVRLQKPKMFKVIILNDDKTTDKTVIRICMEVFRFNEKDAEAKMLEVHHDGSAIVGIYSKEVAEMKVNDSIKIARERKEPLRVIYEEE